MTLEIFYVYLNLIVASLAGMFIMLLSKSTDMQSTAKLGNVQYEGFGTFLKRDWKAVAANVLAIVATFNIFGKAVYAMDVFMADKSYELFGFNIPLEYVWHAFVAIFFFCTGYAGQDFILRRVFKSVQNKLIKDKLDEKTTELDRQRGTLDSPDPVK